MQSSRQSSRLDFKELSGKQITAIITYEECILFAHTVRVGTVIATELEDNLIV